MTPSPGAGVRLTHSGDGGRKAAGGLPGSNYLGTAETHAKVAASLYCVGRRGNHLNSISYGLHVRKDVGVQFETGYQGPPIASAERSCGTAKGSRAQVLNEAHSRVAPKGYLLCTIGLGLIRAEFTKKLQPYMKKRDLGWAWNPPPEERIKLTFAERRLLEHRRKQRLKRQAKKARKDARHVVVPSPAKLSAQLFYDSWEWKKLRFEVLKTYGAVCMCCRSTERIVVDHIRPRRKFPHLELIFDNLQVLCDSCNRGKSWDDYTDFRNHG